MCYDSTRSEMHLELKAVRDINNSHIRKSTCLYTHLYTPEEPSDTQISAQWGFDT